MNKNLIKNIGYVLSSFAILATQGCSVASIGNTATNSVINPLFIPTVHKMMEHRMACHFGNAMQPLLQVLADNGSTTVSSTLSELYGLSAYCYEEPIANEEVKYHQALRAKHFEAAENALIMVKRLTSQAALRYLEASRAGEKYYGRWGGDCPTLTDNHDRARFAIALTTGLQAVSYNLNSGNMLNVGIDLLNQVAKSAQCLGDFWGVKDAITGLVWLVNPTIKPENVDAWSTLEKGVALAEEQGIRVAHALYANAAVQADDSVRLKSIIRRAYQMTLKQPAFKLQDDLALSVLQRFSDGMWAKEKGHATPMDQLGAFSDDTKPSSLDLGDELLK